jgi:hypothetical protein
VIAGALASLGVPYSIVGPHPSARTLKRYRAVIWEASVDRYEGQLNAGDRTAIQRYLDSGGKLMLSSNRVIDGLGDPNASPQSSGDAPDFAAHYFGFRLPEGNGTYVVVQEQPATVTGHGLLAKKRIRIEPAPTRPFIGIAGLAQAGNGGNGTVVKPYGTARGIGTLNKGALAAVQQEKDTPFIGISVDGDAKHNNFKTVTFGWNIGDDVNSASTVKLLKSVLRHFKVPLHSYKVHGRPLVYHEPIRDQVSGRSTPITAIVLGKKAPVRLYYRRHGRGGFYVKRMHRSGARGAYLGRIPGRAVTPDGVDYYIKVGRGRTFDPVGAGAGVVYHGIAVSLPELAKPVKVLPHGV